jgi:hypothetical protein
VSVGRYNEEHIQMTAAQAVAMVLQCEYIGGYEVIIPRKIMKDEILRVQSVSQVIGWRYYPEAHGKKQCGCPYCQRGLYGAQKLRDRFEKGFSNMKKLLSKMPLDFPRTKNCRVALLLNPPRSHSDHHQKFR